jgi:G-patch domain
MADDGDGDDYLSDKFLTVAEPQKPKTYSDKRKEALRKSHLKNERNRTKSRRQLELESREEGLSKSLFERAEDDKAIGHGAENKALSMMMKMGFKPGQALGVPADVDQVEDAFPSPQPPPSPAPTHPMTPRRDVDPSQETSILQPAEKQERHLVNPLPLNEWSGTSSSISSMRCIGTRLSPPPFPLFASG